MKQIKTKQIAVPVLQLVEDVSQFESQTEPFEGEKDFSEAPFQEGAIDWFDTHGDGEHLIAGFDLNDDEFRAKVDLRKLDEAPRTWLRWASKGPLRQGLEDSFAKPLIEAGLVGVRKGLFGSLYLIFLGISIYQLKEQGNLQAVEELFDSTQRQEHGINTLVQMMARLASKTHSYFPTMMFLASYVLGAGINVGVKQYRLTGLQKKIREMDPKTLVTEMKNRSSDYYKSVFRKPEYYLGFLASTLEWLPPFTVLPLFDPVKGDLRGIEDLINVFHHSEMEGLVDHLTLLVENSHHQLQREAMGSLRNIAYGISMIDLERDTEQFMGDLTETNVMQEKLKNCKAKALNALTRVTQRGFRKFNASDPRINAVQRYMYGTFLLWSLDPLGGTSKSEKVAKNLAIIGGLAGLWYLKLALLVNLYKGIQKAIECPDKEGFNYKIGEFEAWADELTPTCFLEYVKLFRNATILGKASQFQPVGDLLKLISNVRLDGYMIDQLDLSGKNITDDELYRILSHLDARKIKGITELKIGNIYQSPQLSIESSLIQFADSKLRQLVAQMTIQWLNFAGNVSDVNLALLMKEFSHSSLRNLTYFSSQTSISGLQTFSHLLARTPVTTLDLVYLKGGDFTAPLCGILNNPNLKDVQIRMGCTDVTLDSSVTCDPIPSMAFERFQLLSAHSPGDFSPFLKPLFSSPNFQMLSLCQFKQEFFETLGELMKTSRLETLMLEGDEFCLGCDYPSAENIQMLSENIPNSLTKFVFSVSPNNPSALSLAIQNLLQTNINHLGILYSGDAITQQPAQAIRDNLPTSKLQFLDFGYSHIDPDAFSTLLEGVKDSPINKLEIYNLDDNAFVGLTTIDEKSVLKQMDIYHSSLDKNFAYVFMGLPPTFRVLDMSRSNVSPYVINTISLWLPDLNLTSLSISFPKEALPNLAKFSDAVRRSSLTQLSLGVTGSSGVEWFPTLPNFLQGGIEVLDIAHVPVNGGTAEFFFSYLTNSQIKSLKMAHINVESATALDSLTYALPNTKLRVFEDFNSYGSQSLARFIRQLPNSNLDVVDISGHVDEDVIKAIRDIAVTVRHIKLNINAWEIDVSQEISFEALSATCQDAVCNANNPYHGFKSHRPGGDPTLTEYIATHQLMAPQPAGLGGLPFPNASMASNQSAQALLAGPASGAGAGSSDTVIALAVGAIATATVAGVGYVYRDHLRAGWRKMWGYFGGESDE